MKKASLKVKKVLIVEDEPSVSRILIDELVREGFWVFEARNGEEGLGIALIEHPDLILLDILMPKKDGLRMLNELRKDSWGKNVPVIILSNLSDPPRVSEALKNGVCDFLVKSECRLESVLDKIKSKLPSPL